MAKSICGFAQCYLLPKLNALWRTASCLLYTASDQLILCLNLIKQNFCTFTSMIMIYTDSFKTVHTTYHIHCDAPINVWSCKICLIVVIFLSEQSFQPSTFLRHTDYICCCIVAVSAVKKVLCFVPWKVHYFWTSKWTYRSQKREGESVKPPPQCKFLLKSLLKTEFVKQQPKT